jgi:hypothetical protein
MLATYLPVYAALFVSFGHHSTVFSDFLDPPDSFVFLAHARLRGILR